VKRTFFSACALAICPIVILAATALAGGTEVVLQPGMNIQNAIDAYDVVKLAPGNHFIFSTLLISRSVKLAAQDPRDKPSIICTKAATRVFTVDAPDARVSMENLKVYSQSVGINSSSLVLKCGHFEINGCEPVEPGTYGSIVITDKKFGLVVGHIAGVQPGKLSEIGRFVATNNVFDVPAGSHCFEAYRYDLNGADFFFHRNSFAGGVAALFLNYKSLVAIDNDFTCEGYISDFVGAGLVVASQLEDSWAMLNQNRIHMNIPDPYIGVMGMPTWGMPMTLGSPIYDVPAYNAEIKNTVVDSQNASGDGRCEVPSAVIVWKAYNCSIAHVDYSDIDIQAFDPYKEGGYSYPKMGDVMKVIGKSRCPNPPSAPCMFYYPAAFSGEVQALGPVPSTEYFLAYSSDTKLIDNANPNARVTEFATTGTRLPGKLGHVKR